MGKPVGSCRQAFLLAGNHPGMMELCSGTLSSPDVFSVCRSLACRFRSLPIDLSRARLTGRIDQQAGDQQPGSFQIPEQGALLI